MILILQILFHEPNMKKMDKTKKKNICDVDKIIPDVSGLVKKTDFKTKVTEIESKIPINSNLVKKTNFSSTVTEIEGKIPNVSNLVKKQTITLN